jgi:hypothetical protein
MLFRVSEAESFRQWRESDAEVDVLLSRLRGLEPPSEAMLAGTAFHKALELAQPGDFDMLEANGFRFKIEAGIELALPEVRELRACKQYGPITITGQVDALPGLRVEDHKTTARFDPDRYLQGYQWRFYLDIFEASVFRWNVFEIKQLDDKLYSVYGFHVLEQFRYSDLEGDCTRLAADLAEFAQIHMPERLTEQAA